MPANLKSRTYLAAVSVAGLVAMGVSAPSLPVQEWRGLLLFAALCGAAQLMPVSLFRSSSVSVSAGITFAGLILYGPAAAIWINLGSAAVAAFRPRQKPVYKAIFNIGNHALAAAVAGLVYLTLGGTSRPPEVVTAILPVLLAAACYFLVQTVIISGIIALTEQTSFFRTWDANFRRSGLNFVALAVISISVAGAEMSIGTAGMLVFSAPLVMAWYVFKYLQFQAGSSATPESQVSQ